MMVPWVSGVGPVMGTSSSAAGWGGVLGSLLGPVYPLGTSLLAAGVTSGIVPSVGVWLGEGCCRLEAALFGGGGGGAPGL